MLSFDGAGHILRCKFGCRIPVNGDIALLHLTTNMDIKDQTDSGIFDNFLEVLTISGRPVFCILILVDALPEQ